MASVAGPSICLSPMELARHPASTGLRVAGDDLPPALRPYVREIYEERFEMPEAGAPLPLSAHVDPFLHVTFSGGMTVRLDALGIPPFRLPTSTISGPLADTYTGTFHGLVHGFYVRFAPVGPLALLGVRDYGLGPRGAPALGEMVRPDLREHVHAWEQELRSAPDFAARAALAERFLLDRVATPTPEVALLLHAAGEIERAAGAVRVSDLAERLGVSGATLRRRFAVLGLSPKTFAAVVRFQNAHAFLFTTPGATWADAVERFGYADQAHLVREHRRFAGVPPTRWNRDVRLVDRRMGAEGVYDGPVADRLPA